jgi:hypothetical protein
MSENWLPLESNSEALNEYLLNLGVKVEKVKIYDIYSIEDWALEMIP